ncbi:(deoxy)nucleoside triphosphate pyrophosphohydrolase [Umezawaea beigongshangensis]|uniref:(deoxy)nucleoside triphosphate pyrophosphohydrolase n=1 Tax=Umezawaea beigongshangensis TaxID=2780383 RepID=UPI001E362CD6|nr:NUDIX domain-containing protein [Umezawaea beigongshangensis]
MRAEQLAAARVVVGAAIVRDGRLLVQQRAWPERDAGRWELPGGRVEPGESDAAALERECAEELDAHVVAGERRGPDVPLKPDLLLRVLTATLVSGEPRPVEHRALRWITAAELTTLDWLPADRALLPSLRPLLPRTAS